MKWLFFSLLLVNVSLYLWATGHPQNNITEFRTAETEVNGRSMMLLEERAALTGSSERTCMRIGPFLTQSTFADASRLLQEMGLSYSKTAVSARKLKTYRAFVDSPENGDELEILRKKLDSISIDHYRFEEGDVAYLSVGLFSQPSDARNFVTKLKKEDINVKYRPELRTLGPLRWIEVDDLPDRYALDQLKEIRWGDAMAKVVRFPCVN